MGRVAAVRAWLAHVDAAELTDRERIDLVAELERLKGSASAAQGRATHALRESREQVAPQDAARSVGSEVALARRESPNLGDRFVGLSRALVREMPCTMRALTEGVIGERHALAVVQATSTLSLPDRAEVDRRVGPLLGRLGAEAAGRAAKRVAAELDAASIVRRMEEAARSRRVTVRAAPDGMAYLTVLAPLRDAVGAYAALRNRASAVVGGQCPDEAPDGRGLGAVMADAATRLMSGRAEGQVQPVEVHLVMTDTSLFGPAPAPAPDPGTSEGAAQPQGEQGGTSDGRAWPPAHEGRTSEDRARPPTQEGRTSEGRARPPSQVGGTSDGTAGPPTQEGQASEGAVGPPSRDTETSEGAAPPGTRGGNVMEPARIPGHGSVPAPVARQWVREAGDGSVWLRRLYTSPDGRDLVAMDSRRRVFTGLLRRMLVLRDDRCTTPWCDGMVAHADHATPVREGSATDFDTGNGKCARCNYVKEAPGWRVAVTGGGSSDVLGRGPDAAPGDARALPWPVDGRRSTSAADADEPTAWSVRHRPSGPHELEVTTPLGRRYRSTAPPLLGWGWQSPPTRTGGAAVPGHVTGAGGAAVPGHLAGAGGAARPGHLAGAGGAAVPGHVTRAKGAAAPGHVTRAGATAASGPMPCAGPPRLAGGASQETSRPPPPGQGRGADERAPSSAEHIPAEAEPAGIR